MNFKLEAPYRPCGDQPQVIEGLVQGIEQGMAEQVLLGVTGSGKTFTMANVIERLNRPTLVMSHNKTLAAQLAAEFKTFFPQNAVEYFVSYYDYYQPEAYVPSSDTYIEKDASINQQIDRLRHAATHSLLTRRDVIIVASVSCIYGLGSPEDYERLSLLLEVGGTLSRRKIIKRLLDMRYERNDITLDRGRFRVRGDTVDIYPAYVEEEALRVELWGDEIESIVLINPLTGQVKKNLSREIIFPASHYAIPKDKMEKAIEQIEEELEKRLAALEQAGQVLEYQRLKMRTNYDIEMMRELGYCSGIENYSRYFSGRKLGEAPFVLLDYFPDDFLLFMDESHVTLPQVRAMYHGDQARKKNLVEHGFRLPSAYDNRPLKFEEFQTHLKQAIYVSATPGEYELKQGEQVLEQVIRPTGLLDPEVFIRPVGTQVDDLIAEIEKQVVAKERTLVTTLTKKMSEDLTKYLEKLDIKVRYMHSDIDTLERLKIIKLLRKGEIDVLVGVNLLREGLDMPEVSLVAILDADKEGFLRNEKSLIQTMGRAARHVNGRVILYADQLTGSIKAAVSETKRRRKIQMTYNQENGITPQSVSKVIRDLMDTSDLLSEDLETASENYASAVEKLPPLEQSLLREDRQSMIIALEEEMRQAAMDLNFEKAALLRDQIKHFDQGYFKS